MPDNDAPLIEQPDPDRVYRNYLVTCERLSVEPVSREHAQDLMAEWSEVIARSAVPPTRH